MKVYTMTFDDMHIAFCEKYSPESMLDFVKEIYTMYHDLQKPMYVYFNNITLILTIKDDFEDMSIVGNLTKSIKPEISDKCNIFTLDTNDDLIDDSDLSYDLTLDVSLDDKPKTIVKINNMLDDCYSDTRRCFFPFDIVHCNEN
jgi:hypothetical protein